MSVASTMTGTLDYKGSYFSWDSDLSAVLDNNVLKIFDEEDKLVICLDFRIYSCMCEKISDEPLQFKIYFENSDDHSPFVFRAKTEEEADSWVKALDKHI